MNPKDILKNHRVYVDLTSVNEDKHNYDLAYCEELFAIAFIHLNNAGTEFAVVSLDKEYDPLEDPEGSIHAMVFTSIEEALEHIDNLAMTWYQTFAEPQDIPRPDYQEIDQLFNRRAGAFSAQLILDRICYEIQSAQIIHDSH